MMALDFLAAERRGGEQGVLGDALVNRARVA